MPVVLATLQTWSWGPGHPYAYPALEVLHIVGIALLLGNLLLFELKVLGLGPGLHLSSLARLALSVSVCGFLLAACSGLAMFMSQPAELLLNRAFQLKMSLLLLAGLNALLFHWRGGLVKLDRLAKLQTALSLGLWLAVIICGRWIAYV